MLLVQLQEANIPENKDKESNAPNKDNHEEANAPENQEEENREDT